jgi:hypothetical protein
MIRPSFVPPPIRRLRDVTRYRIDLVGVRTAEKNRVEKLLEDAQIKLSVVASDIFGKSGRDMMGALVAGERNPKARYVGWSGCGLDVRWPLRETSGCRIPCPAEASSHAANRGSVRLCVCAGR